MRNIILWQNLFGMRLVSLCRLYRHCVLSLGLKFISEDLATACSDDSNEPPDPITYQSAIRFANDGPYASRGDRSAPIDLHPTFGGIVSSDGPTSDSSRDRNSHIFNLGTTDQATRMSIDDRYDISCIRRTILIKYHSSLDCGEAASNLGMSIPATARTQRPSNPQNQSTNHVTFDEHNICPEMRNFQDGRPTHEEYVTFKPPAIRSRPDY